jgi:hypothetical protein
MLSVVILNVIMLSVVAPLSTLPQIRIVFIRARVKQRIDSPLISVTIKR